LTGPHLLDLGRGKAEPFHQHALRIESLDTGDPWGHRQHDASADDDHDPELSHHDLLVRHWRWRASVADVNPTTPGSSVSADVGLTAPYRTV
jgi:hypothetical protein